MRTAAALAACATVFAPVAEARGPEDAEAKRLVAAFFDAPPEERAKALEALAPVDALTAEETEAWRKPLLALAARGKKSPGKAKNHLYPGDKRTPDRGLYLLGGDRGAKGGLLVALHGGGEGQGDAGSAASAFAGCASSLHMLLAAPEVLVKSERGWTDPPETEAFVMEMVETLKRSYRIDPNRVYLTGHSMGGFGTWTLGAAYADTFGGLAAFAGAPVPLREAPDGPIVAIQDGVLPNLRNVPLFLYQSLDDTNVPPDANVFAAARLKRLAEDDPGGWPHLYEQVDGRGHGFPEKGPLPGIAWATRAPRDPRPGKVVWQPTRPAKRHFYWLWWERPALGTTVTAEAKGRSRIEVTSTGATDELSVLLDDRLVDLSKEVEVVRNGTRTWKGVPTRSLRTMAKTALRNDADLLFVAEVPVDGPPR